MFGLIVRPYLVFRSDEQRSEKHKLKKEKELEEELAAAEKEDDGGFSLKVKLIFKKISGYCQYSKVTSTNALSIYFILLVFQSKRILENSSINNFQQNAKFESAY